ncbi:hypothetical protein [Enterovirga sp.]|uniref:hypothetical protein n=1 Tax=Enterovirga sp. TaxID=2026350 RepID=UPI002B661C9F|nr:hypothetical protein [Enterovirga sp.]HMO29388.1 hypothetical protein [Enterovirga sp.]
MPIIYMHGVNTRTPSHFAPVKEYLRRIVAPAIAPDPENVSIRAADWFQFCPPPKWGGISRPRTAFRAQGAAEAPRNEVLDSLASKLPKAPSAPRAGGLTSGQVTSPAQNTRIDTLPDEELADLIALSIRPPPEDGKIETEAESIERARIGAAADRVAQDREIRQRLAAAPDLDAQLKIVADAVQKDVEAMSGLSGQGAVGDFFRGMRDRVTESISRVGSAPAAGLTVVASELRPTLNDFATRFIGDVLYYMKGRGKADAPGAIPSVLLKEIDLAHINKKERGGEPIVLLTHSMGGQIAYDVISSFLPASGNSAKVDFWCATASQVGFFEELNMFLASSVDYSKATGRRMPLATSNLGHWWNLWDSNDIISFTTKGIFADGIDDEEFWSGMSVAAAHGGYLERPSFYRLFAEKLSAAFPDRTA